MEEEKPQQTEASLDSNVATPKNAPGNGVTKKQKALFILLILAVVGGWFGLRWWIKSQTHVETDNAFIEARSVPVSFKVPGTVKRVLIKDNQFVKQGDLLLELDSVDYEVKRKSAAADLDVSINETSGDYAQIDVVRAALGFAKAKLEQAETDLRRARTLFAREVISKEQLEKLETARNVAQSQYKAVAENLNREQVRLGLSGNGFKDAKIAQKKAKLEEAQLQIFYTRITAPHDGYVTRKNVEPGMNIQAGQPLLALVPLQDAWITANYKESQLTHIKPGQKVEFTVDAYPGRKFTGRVDSVMAGTGAAFSLLPPENATGNYVKVVQRVPVKILIDNNSDPEQLLRVGMSVIPTVLVGRTAGDVLKELNPFK